MWMIYNKYLEEIYFIIYVLEFKWLNVFYEEIGNNKMHMVIVINVDIVFVRYIKLITTLEI